MGQYIEDHAGRGQGVWSRQVYGSLGSMSLPGDRSGGNIVLNIDGESPIDDEKILEYVPDFRLDAVTSDLWGGDLLWRYEFPFPETDRKIIAIEYGDFAQAIAGEHQVEVDAAQGTRICGCLLWDIGVPAKLGVSSLSMKCLLSRLTTIRAKLTIVLGI